MAFKTPWRDYAHEGSRGGCCLDLEADVRYWQARTTHPLPWNLGNPINCETWEFAMECAWRVACWLAFNAAKADSQAVKSLKSLKSWRKRLGKMHRGFRDSTVACVISWLFATLQSPSHWQQARLKPRSVGAAHGCCLAEDRNCEMGFGHT